MKALTIYQPWASLIYTGAKKIETRSWKTSYRGPIAIHAAKRWDIELQSWLCDTMIKRGLAPLVGLPLDLDKPVIYSLNDIKNLYKGAILATCDLIDCVPVESLTVEQLKYEQYFGDFTSGRYAWILDNVKALNDPVKINGKQRLWNW